MTSFKDLGLQPALLRALDDLGFDTPTPIQSEAIPLLLQGEDLIGQAQTGTGKTAAFGIPLISATEGRGVQTLVLCPTRELALQVTDALNELAKHADFKAVSIFGGVGMGNQRAAFRAKSTTCVVACPGRLLDHLSENRDLLAGVHTLVLDEADRMLDMGFLPDVERIIRHVPTKRQTMLFSATMPDAIKALSQKHMRHPEIVRTGEDALTTPLSEQSLFYVEKDHKFPTLVSLLKREGDPRTIVFTRTKHLARRLGQRLSKAGVPADALHGDLSQNQRERALNAFRDGKARVLVATDVAARGLDVPDVTHVVNYDVPKGEPEAYVHRIGRTGRAGKSGRAFLFVEPGQDGELRAIERLVDTKIRVETIQVDPRLLEEAAAAAARGRSNAERHGGGRGQGPRGGGRAGHGPRGAGGRSGGAGRGGGGGGRGGGRSTGGRGGAVAAVAAPPRAGAGRASRRWTVPAHAGRPPAPS